MGVFSQHSPGSAVSESEGFGREPPARVWPSLSPWAGPRPLPGAKPAPALRGSGAGGGAAGCRPGAPPGCALPAGGAGGETETGRLRKRRRCGDAGATPRRARPGPAAATQTQTPPRGPGHCTPGLRPASHPCTRGALNPALGTPRPAGALAPAARPARTSCRRFLRRAPALLPPLRARVRPGSARLGPASLCRLAPPSGPAPGRCLRPRGAGRASGKRRVAPGAGEQCAQLPEPGAQHLAWCPQPCRGSGQPGSGPGDTRRSIAQSFGPLWCRPEQSAWGVRVSTPRAVSQPAAPERSWGAWHWPTRCSRPQGDVVIIDERAGACPARLSGPLHLAHRSVTLSFLPLRMASSALVGVPVPRARALQGCVRLAPDRSTGAGAQAALSGRVARSPGVIGSWPAQVQTPTRDRPRPLSRSPGVLARIQAASTSW